MQAYSTSREGVTVDGGHAVGVGVAEFAVTFGGEDLLRSRVKGE